MRVVSIVGARPQFIKVAMVCRAAARQSLDHTVIHTGQHYDADMSEVFFQELGISPPEHDLKVGSGSHAVQTGQIMVRLEPILLAERPDWVLIYGDTNSTAAGAVVATKAGIPTAHVEAGLRSYNRRMPEEVNRLIADRVSDLLLCPTAAAMENLAAEGLAGRAVLCGDVMYDAALTYRQVAAERANGVAAHWRGREFALATIHRAENTDNFDRLRGILAGLDRIAREICPVLLPLHPRTRKVLETHSISHGAVTLCAPASYLEMVLLEGSARFIVTDSGGVQKEAYFYQKPCITVRDETEWVETLQEGCNVLAGADPERIFAAAQGAGSAGPWTAVYGDGDAGTKILDALAHWKTSGEDWRWRTPAR
jgi:UDP-GlcNAc3NAcA epimerase